MRRRDEPQVLAEYKERQKWRQERKKLNQQLMELSPAERREARQQIKLYQELGLEKLPLDKDVAFDGTVLDSRADESDIIGLSQKAFKHLDASMMI